MTPIDNLVRRLQEAKAADRFLDALIWAEINNRTVWGSIDTGYFGISRTDTQDRKLIYQKKGSLFITSLFVPRYTSSVDAAMTLVPEGMHGAVSWNKNEFVASIGWLKTSPSHLAAVHGATLSIAISLGALKLYTMER